MVGGEGRVKPQNQVLTYVKVKMFVNASQATCVVGGEGTYELSLSYGKV